MLQKEHLTKFNIQQMGVKGNFSNLLENIHKTPTANIKLNDEKLGTFPLIWGKKQVCPLLPLVFNIIPEGLASA